LPELGEAPPALSAEAGICATAEGTNALPATIPAVLRKLRREIFMTVQPPYRVYEFG
jgi:hypothetical protein